MYVVLGILSVVLMSMYDGDCDQDDDEYVNW